MKSFKDIKQSLKEAVKPVNNAGISYGVDEEAQWRKDIAGMFTASSAAQVIRDSVNSMSTTPMKVMSKTFPGLKMTPYISTTWRNRGKREPIPEPVLREHESFLDGEFQYQKLDPNADFIRFLHLQPGTKDDPISVKMVVSPVTDLAPFEALSYTWGNTSIKKTISLDGFAFKIHRNAWWALLNLRQENEVRILWVDAICINQQDNADKNHYVPMMTFIYEHASRVCVWMRPVHVDMSSLLKIVSKIASLQGQDKPVEESRRAVAEAELTAHGLPEIKDPIWKSVDHLLSSQWFSRIWIIQEITLARNAILVSGSGSCPWEGLKQASHYIADHGLTALVNVDPSQILRLESMKKVFDDKTPVLELAQIARASKATNEKDKIYGLLGLAADGQDFTPDYSTSSDIVFRDIALQIMERDQSLAILNAVEHWGDFSVGQAQVFSTLPSWVPNWTLCGTQEPLPETAKIHHSNLVMSTNAEITDLQVRGLEIGTVKDAGDTFNEFVPVVGNSVQEITGTKDYMNAVHAKRWRQWTTFANKCTDYPSGEHPRDAYIRCLVAGTLASDIKDGEELAAIYEKWLKFWKMVGRDRGQHLGEYLQCTPEEDVAVALGYMAAHKAAAYGRRFIVLKEGWFALAPFKARAGDKVVVLFGGKTPYVLRPEKKSKGEGVDWMVLGECYVHGIPKDIFEGELYFQTFNLR